MTSTRPNVCWPNYYQTRGLTYTATTVTTANGTARFKKHKQFNVVMLCADMFSVMLSVIMPSVVKPVEQQALNIVNNCLNTNIYSYLETSAGQSSNPYFNVIHFFNTRVN
jgi:hypothetical protein